MAAAAGAGGAPMLKRDQLVRLTIGMLEKKGQAMAKELMRRVDANQPLEVRGIRVGVDVLEEALDKYASSSADAAAAAAAASAAAAPSSAPAASSTASAGSDGSDAGAKAEAAALKSPQKAPKTSGRWNPGPVTASLIAARAQMECERAETFCKKVKILPGAKVGILDKPDIFSDPTGEFLAENEIVEVVARFACQRDGRVYLRLRKERSSWISTRSRKDISKLVMSLVDGDKTLLEPKGFGEALTSKARELLPELDVGGLSPSKAPAVVEAPPDLNLGEEDAGDLDEDVFEEDAACDEDEEDDGHEGDGDGEGEDEDEDDHGEDGDPADAAAPKASASSGSPAKAKRARMFRVVAGRCPVLRFPRGAELMATGHKVFLKMKQTFWADAVVYAPSEGRSYLRLNNGSGWVSERSRSDLSRCAVVPGARRRKPLSKKMARIIAFRGGDVSGEGTTLRKDDLVRNSQGKIVSKRASEAAKARFQDSSMNKWSEAVKRAKTELNLTGFVAVKKGTEVYEKARVYFEEAKKK
eukprot:TRINITY_DN21809_c0_g3_i1.p1 TRINITY_DN21809_c0_g3~~TRINITY_DN21809_c0_g3_i1.p1  ORF type:complete len:542 (-),score=138.83 TRINITY_DN21809_c0_g3_i1:13-1596(-)